MSDISLIVNRLTNAFNRAMSEAAVAETEEDMLTHLKTMSILFTEVCSTAQCFAAERDEVNKEVEELIELTADSKAKDDSYQDLVKQLHLILQAKHIATQEFAQQALFDQLQSFIMSNVKEIEELHTFKSLYGVEKKRSERLINHIKELSKKVVLQKIGARFYAREVAALRQMMDLVRNAKSVETAAKSKVWDQIEAENNIMRVNALWLINRINSNKGDDSYSDYRTTPRIVILMRSHIHQGLGLEIKGGSGKFRSVIISAKMKGSMADDDQLHVGDRILAIDGTFVTNTTTHSEVMQMLEDESTKDFLALIVSSFDPWRYESDAAFENKIVKEDEITAQGSSD